MAGVDRRRKALKAMADQDVSGNERDIAREKLDRLNTRQGILIGEMMVRVLRGVVAARRNA